MKSRISARVYRFDQCAADLADRLDASASIRSHQAARSGNSRVKAAILASLLRKQPSQLPSQHRPPTFGRCRSNGCLRQNAVTSCRDTPASASGAQTVQRSLGAGLFRRSGSSARRPTQLVQWSQPRLRRYRFAVLIFSSVVQNRACWFGRYRRLRISASNGSPWRAALLWLTISKNGASARYSSHTIRTAQRRLTSSTKSSVCGISRPVFWNVTSTRSGSGPLASRI